MKKQNKVKSYTRNTKPGCEIFQVFESPPCGAGESTLLASGKLGSSKPGLQPYRLWRPDRGTGWEEGDQYWAGSQRHHCTPGLVNSPQAELVPSGFKEGPINREKEGMWLTAGRGNWRNSTSTLLHLISFIFYKRYSNKIISIIYK